VKYNAKILLGNIVLVKTQKSDEIVYNFWEKYMFNEPIFRVDFLMQ